MTPRAFLALVALALLAAEPGHLVVPGESRASADRLDEARRRVAVGKGLDAVELLQSLIEAPGNDLASVGDGRSVSARLLAHAVVAKLPPEGLAAYRKRLDVQARRWLDQANESGATEPLQRLVEEAFCTPQALTALDRLGDRAFERGRFDEAEAWWRRIAPLERIEARDKDAAAVEYPDPSAAAVARAGAKQLLARNYRGHPGWKADLDAYRKRYPKAAGRLAGRNGQYADTLAAVGVDPRPPGTSGDWPAFGGGPSRGRIAVAPPRLLDNLSRLGRAGPVWVFDLEQRARQDGPASAVKKGGELDAARRLAFYPALVGHHAVVADARYVTAYDLRTGQVETWYDAVKAGVGGLFPSLGLPAASDLRYAVTAAEGSIFARLGTQSVRDVRPRPRIKGEPRQPSGDVGESQLVSLSLTPGPSGQRLRWSVRGFDVGRKEYAIFEGAPLVHDGRVWIAASRFEGDRVMTAVHCYPAHPEDTTAPLLWRTEVCETRELLPDSSGADLDRKQRRRHHLLTLVGSKVVYCSHSGAVVALDARTGRRAWAVRYPRRDVREPDDNPSLRDLLPPLHAEGRLYIAPSDSDRLMCLDPNTGATIWDRDRLDVVHLVGVGHGRLIFTTWRNPAMGRLDAGGLRAVMADTGDDVGGWVLPDDGGGLVPFGRPVLVGDLVLWPTARRPYGVFAVRQEDGQQPDNPALLHRIPSGNLVWANGCLLVADAHVLTAFVPPDWLPDGDEVRMGRRDDPSSRPRWLTSRRVHPGGAEGATDGGDKPRRSGERLDIRLDPHERFLHADDAIVCSKPDELRCRSRDTGEVAWRAALPFTPAWSRQFNGLLLVGGEHGLAGLDAEKGDVRWSFLAPRPLSDFHVAGPRVICIQDERHLLCLDALDGAVRWRRSAPGAAFEMPAPRGRISWLCPLDDSRLLVQASAYRWLLDAKTGGVVSSSASPLPPWPRQPVVGAAGVCVVPDQRNVLMLDVGSGKTLWSHKLPGVATRSGEPPLVVPASDTVVVIEPLNIGYRARKLDRATGKPLWRDTAPLDIEALQPAGWHAANGKLYHAGGDHLSAWSLADGRPLWKRPLPADGSWRVEHDGKHLLAWRDRAAAVRFRFRWLGAALQWHVGPLPAGDAWSVLVLDAEKGELLRRIAIDPESLPRRPATSWDTRPSVWPTFVADRDETGAAGPTLVRDRRGLVAAVGNRIVALAVPPSK